MRNVRDEQDVKWDMQPTELYDNKWWHFLLHPSGPSLQPMAGLDFVENLEKYDPVRRPSLYLICSSFLPASNIGALAPEQLSPDFSLLSSENWPTIHSWHSFGQTGSLGVPYLHLLLGSCPDLSFTSSFTLLLSEHLQYSPEAPMTPTQMLITWTIFSSTTCFLT